ncbi:MAG: cytidylate kinase-like family protein [Lachnospiraceae bacterium]|nr:cytidylate kinase-like family protein [Lachnospiraceae bacterium]
MKKVITISRTYGSGGREIGIRLAARLNVPFYDKELISMIAKEGNFETAMLEENDEVAPVFENYTSYVVPPYYQIAMTEKIYKAQCKVIQDLAAKGPCVIVGRCANAILDDSIDIFIYADTQARLRRLARLNPDLSEQEILGQMKAVDKKRAEYHTYYSGREWGNLTDYDLCINSGLSGIDGALRTVLTYAEGIADE